MKLRKEESSNRPKLIQLCPAGTGDTATVKKASLAPQHNSTALLQLRQMYSSFLNVLTIPVPMQQTT